MKIKIVILTAILIFSQNLSAQNDEPISDYTPGILHSLAVGVEYRVKAGLLIGGTSPIPVPLEIQK
ncbi:MAG: PorT family protein, partial [Prevotellaceae bacterium]|nr:PorT family protein [Prevotellaceae bacterium]